MKLEDSISDQEKNDNLAEQHSLYNKSENEKQSHKIPIENIEVADLNQVLKKIVWDYDQIQFSNIIDYDNESIDQKQCQILNSLDFLFQLISDQISVLQFSLREINHLQNQKIEVMKVGFQELLDLSQRSQSLQTKVNQRIGDNIIFLSSINKQKIWKKQIFQNHKNFFIYGHEPKLVNKLIFPQTKWIGPETKQSQQLCESIAIHKDGQTVIAGIQTEIKIFDLQAYKLKVLMMKMKILSVDVERKLKQQVKTINLIIFALNMK